MRNLVLMGIVFLMLTVGITPPATNVLSYSGETVTAIGGAVIGGCTGALIGEHMKDKKEQQQVPAPAPAPRDRVIIHDASSDCFEQCDERFPRESDDANFMKCLEVCQ